MKKVLAILLAALLTASALIGCGGGSSPAGVYTLKTMEADGQTVTIDDLQTMLDMFSVFAGEDVPKLVAKDLYKLELTADGQVKIAIYEEDEKVGTYKVEGKNITLTIDGESMTGTLENGQITIELDGSKTVFAK